MVKMFSDCLHAHSLINQTLAEEQSLCQAVGLQRRVGQGFCSANIPPCE